MVVHGYRYIIQFLTLTAAFVWLAVWSLPDNNLHIIACDVGQGDAILVIHNNIQILTDGGPNKRVIECLSKYIPLWDREIELVISTHPDADHSTGLIEVIKRYKVDTLLTNNINPSTQVWEALIKEVGSRDISVIHPDKGMKLGVGMIYLDILHPTGELPMTNDQLPKIKTNDYSIVFLLKYAQFKALFTGDIEDNISDQIAINSKIETVNYLKVPHHGSKNGLSENLLKATEPKVAVISVGAKNSYGHPHKEVLDMLMEYKVKVLRTDEVGDVEVITDGERVWMSAR